MGDNIDLYGDFNESDDAAAVGDDDENVPKDGDQEDEGTKVDVNPKVRRTKSTLFVLNDARLMNLERGVSTLEKHYTDIKFQGKGLVITFLFIFFFCNH